MAVGIYKPGQGYWVRVMSAVGAGLIALMGGVWIWDLMKGLRFGDLEPVYVSAGGAAIFIAVLGLIGFWLIGRKRNVVDFMVATEGEMKKVNWSSRREIIGSTWVVIALTLFTALFIFVVDNFVFVPFFRWIGVLDT